mgnify:CR=1 FL=1
MRLPIGKNFIVTAKLVEGLDPKDFCNVGVGDFAGDSVSSIVEKQDLHTGLVGTGIYGFATAKVFRLWALNNLVDRPNGKECPMSEVLNEADTIVNITVDAWLPVGTPKQMLEAARHAND